MSPRRVWYHLSRLCNPTRPTLALLEAKVSESCHLPCPRLFLHKIRFWKICKLSFTMLTTMVLAPECEFRLFLRKDLIYFCCARCFSRAHHSHNSSTTLIFTSSTSRVSISISTSSPVSLNFGIAIKRTVWPVGPSINLVSNAG